MAQSNKKQVMLSYNHNSKQIVKKIFDILNKKNISVCFNDRDMDDNISDRYNSSSRKALLKPVMFSMNAAVDEAEIICCFMTPEYQDSITCKNELQYAKEKNKHIIPCMIGDKENKQWKPTDWLESITGGLNYIDFQEESLSNIQLKTEELISRITNQSSTSVQYNLVDAIKEKYLKKDKIKCMLNEEDAFPIEQNYISLAMVNIEEKAAKYGMKVISNLRNEQDYHWKHHHSKALGVYEEIYGGKTPIYIERFFSDHKNPTKKVLLLGRSKIGKSTFCQYVTYRWAKGKLWSNFELIVLINMLKLTDTRYPATKFYSPTDLVEKEYAPFGNLSMKEKESFLQKCNDGKVLWILDGYDEFTANVSEQLKECLNHIVEKQHYILTSSSCDITISCDIKLEIIGFMHANIPRYVEHFFRQIEGELTNASSQGQKLLDFLYSNRSIYRVASIPVNLELICRLWVDPNHLETKALTMAALYEEFVVWLCRRQKNQEQMTKEAVYKQFDKELQFLEYLAFKTVQNDEIILPLNFLQEAAREVGCDLFEHSRVLQMGILKLYKKKSFETTEQYYFIHPSYQQFLAAHYLLKTLKSSSDNEAVRFISNQKYNERFRLMFIFATGLLAEPDYQSCIDKFWAAVQGEPKDLCGLQHLQLLTECIDELGDSDMFDNRINILNKLWKLFETFLNTKANVIQDNVVAILSKTSIIPHNALIQNNLAEFLLNSKETQKCRILRLISQFPVLQPTEKLFSTLLYQLRDSSDSVRENACTALGNISINTRIIQLTDGLVKALSDNDRLVRISACKTLGKCSEDAVIDRVIASLIKALNADDDEVTETARDSLVKLDEKVTKNQVTDRLIHTLVTDKNFMVRIRACEALGNIAEKTPTNVMITALINALGDEAFGVYRAVHEVLAELSEKASRDEVITGLIHALAVDDNYRIRIDACKLLIEIAEKAPTNEVLTALINALGDGAFDVSRTAHEGLMKLGEKASTDEMITGLINTLRPNSKWTQICVFQIFANIGKKAARADVLTILVNAIADEDEDVRKNACQTLGKFGEKAATNDVIAGLNNALHDNNADVRQNARESLGKISEKTITNEVPSGVVNPIGDKSMDVGRSTCQTLGNTNSITALLNELTHDDKEIRYATCKAVEELGEKAVINELIAALINALNKKDSRVQKKACEILSHIGDKAGTDEVIAALHNILNYKDKDMEYWICRALSKIGEKAANDNVIDYLVNILNESNSDRISACKTLAYMGEKAITDKILDSLVNALRAESIYLREEACETLGKLGEKAATEKVLIGLINALSVNKNYREPIREKICKALGNMGEKAATSEVLAGLVEALRKKEWDMDICKEVCITLGKIGEKAATKAVLEGLMYTIRDKNSDRNAGDEACKTLVKFGEKAATNEVIICLLDVLSKKNVHYYVEREARNAIIKLGETTKTNQVITCLVERFLNKLNNKTDEFVSRALVGSMNSYDAIKDLDTNMITKLTQCLKQCKTIQFEMMPRNQCINVFLETKNNAWIPLVQYMTLLQNVAVTVMDGQIMIYDGKYITQLQVTEPGVLNVFNNIKTMYEHITLKATMTSDLDSCQALLGKKKENLLV
jgi:HEAT repeat protein